MKRFLLHSLWVVLPFCVLAGASWRAWRADEETRRTRLLEEVRESARQGLQVASSLLPNWVEKPDGNVMEEPPLPDGNPANEDARRRYDAGDYQGVLGSPGLDKSASGLSLQSLAALQLLRKETDPERLAGLVRILSNHQDFLSPLFLAEAERRFTELKLPLEGLGLWKYRCERLAMEASLARQIRESGDEASTRWLVFDGVSYCVELRGRQREWRISQEQDVQAAVMESWNRKKNRLPDGLGISVTVGGKLVSGPVGKPILAVLTQDGWRAEVVLADEEAYGRAERRTRNIITAVIGLAGLAVGLGLVLAGRAYARSVEMTRRQSEFMAAVSHEIRTPLTAMQLLAENLESGVADRAGQRADHTRMIREECVRLGELVGNVLAFTREGKSGRYEAFDVAAMVSDAASLVMPMAEKKRIHLSQEIQNFSDPPLGDVPALRRILLNLLDNALKHTPAGGTVCCRAFPVDGKGWTLEVEDTGPGIPPRERERIFEPFYRIGDELRRSTPGTGLGLALVKRTAEAHGGTAFVRDSGSGGALFSIFLPLHPEKNA